MLIGSLFSGGGGGDSGFERAGHQIAFGCEIDAKARSVFRSHNPDVPIYHDVKDITRERLIADGTPVPDLIMGGSPCQDLSVARKRAGLGGERSGLFHEQCRIADELGAAWVVWENVAGAFSSNRGEDFAEVLGGLTGNRPFVPAHGWRNGGVCVGPKRVAVWRVLDAQNFGVPQRRRRVFVVAGPRALARRVVEVLFEPESGGRDSPTRGQSGANSAAATSGRVGTSSGGGLTDVAQCLLGRYGSRGDLETESFILETGEPIQPVVGTLSPGAHGSGASTVNGQDAYTGQLVPVNIHENQRGEISLSDKASAATLGGGNPGQGYAAVTHEAPMGFSAGNSSDSYGIALTVDGVPPLRAGSSGTNQVPTVVYDARPTEVFAAFDSNWSGHYELTNDGTTSPTLKCGGAGGNGRSIAASTSARTIVRRLTPLECERLMGWADGWTAEGITDDGETVEIATTNRYRICGNGIVANVTEWIGNRLPTEA